MQAILSRKMTRLSERFDTKFTSKKQFHKGQREQQQGQDQQLQQREEILGRIMLV